jgi:hypothetical protein
VLCHARTMLDRLGIVNMQKRFSIDIPQNHRLMYGLHICHVHQWVVRLI